MKKIGLIVMLSSALLLSACSGNEGGDSKVEKEGGQKTVVLSVMRKDRFLETAARQFEEQHKDIHIEMKEYKASDPVAEGGMAVESISLGDVEKYVQSVTTQVISGKGADLILMSELPQDKFVAKKLLVNLNDLLSKDSSFDRNALFSNILQASQDGEGLYAMPLSFSLSLFQGNTELLKKANISVDVNKSWNWSQFKDVAQKLKKQDDAEKLISLDPMSLLFDSIDDNYTQLVGQGQPNFDSDLFRNMMTEIKLMYDEGLLSDGMSFDNGNAAFQMLNVFSPEQALTKPRGMDYYQKPNVSGQKVGTPFQPTYSLGINSKSDVQQEAWAFIKFLLSDEMQASPNLTGIPLNKGITDKKFKETLQKIENGTLETMIPLDMLPDSETVKKRIGVVEQLISETNFRRSSDMKVITIVMEEFSSFMSGQKSAEEVSKLIQNRAKTYLNE
ncbi:ABC transporter substrate-binding protein [Paenibacillus sp. NPDC057934]|uniref:ABC transporter substrate-binding protein n=1 Tax=Paenibacillus sp. NPDC057934 TaxID=3346282 RepID=UPI0036DC4FAD